LCRTGPAEEAKRLRQKFGVQPGYFLWISNFYAYKQAELLIDGYALLSPEQRKRHPLVMVGGSWERRGALHKQLRECGMAHAQNFSFDRLARERIEAIRKTIKSSNVRASG
jgi:hypothetical protein